jgi:hypothetical protein
VINVTEEVLLVVIMIIHVDGAKDKGGLFVILVITMGTGAMLDNVKVAEGAALGINYYRNKKLD